MSKVYWSSKIVFTAHKRINQWNKRHICFILNYLFETNTFSLIIFTYWGFHEKGTFSYLCALGIVR